MLIVGEVALAHDGSLNLAHAFIDAIADTGADVVKFQTHVEPDATVLPSRFRVAPAWPQDQDRYAYWARTGFTADQWSGLARHARHRDIAFVSSPFSVAAVRVLTKNGNITQPFWKIPSGEISNMALLDAVKGLDVVLSTGMNSIAEVDRAVARIGNPYAVLQCTSAYPCPPERIGLNMLDVYRARYGCKVGLSDHSGTIYPSLAAATLRADIVEVHVTLSHQMPGPDASSSIDMDDLKRLVEGVRFIEQMRPIQKDVEAASMGEMRELFMRAGL